MTIVLSWIVVASVISMTMCTPTMDSKPDGALMDLTEGVNDLRVPDDGDAMDAILQALPVCGMCAGDNSRICFMCHQQLIQLAREPERFFEMLQSYNALREENSRFGGEEDDTDQNADDLMLRMEKRSPFLTCKCCISLNNKQCCKRCSLTPYYGKRSTEQSFIWI